MQQHEKLKAEGSSLIQSKRRQLYRTTKVIDVCVIFEQCDQHDVLPIFDLLDYTRPNGNQITIFPQDNEPKEFHEKIEAIEKAHAILLVLSDRAAEALTSESGNDTSYFKLIKTACEREKQSKSRILPLFLSRIIEYEGIIGVAKFSTWSYKCKNEEVRMYMERIGSLQGLFVDPTDWVSKYENLYSFWQETHTELVPLSLRNFGNELNLHQIGGVLVGAILGIAVPLFGICCFCCPTPRFLHFRTGCVLGNVISFTILSILLFVFGFASNTTVTTSCPQSSSSVEHSSSSTSDSCDLSYKNELYTTATICGIWAFLIAVVAFFVVKNREKSAKRRKEVEASAQQLLSVQTK